MASIQEQAQKSGGATSSRTDRRVNLARRTEQSGLLGKIAQAMGSNVTVISAVYKGRDNTGRPVYVVRVKPTRGSGSTVVRSVTFGDGKIGAPNYKSSGVPPAGNAQSQQAEDQSLEQAKDRWLATIAKAPGGLSAFHSRNLIRAVNNYKGTAEGLNQMMAQLYKSPNVIGVQGPADEGAGVFDPFAGLDFGGGGGGFAGPEYRAPDRRVVEDMAKGMLTSLVGTVPDELVGPAADLYMKDHRRNFDSQNAEIDPAQSMLEFIRNTAQYQEIHALRPDSEDERTWISNRRQAAAQGGLAQGAQEDFAIDQATVGGDLADVAEGAAMTQLNTSGSAQGTLLQDRLRETAQNFYSRVVV